MTSEGITVKQAEIQKAELEIDQVRESYRYIAFLCRGKELATKVFLLSGL